MATNALHPLISVTELTTFDTGSEDWLLIDARFKLEDAEYGRLAFSENHIPGAVYLHLDEDLSSPVVPGLTGRHPLPDPAILEARLRDIGLRNSMPVVVYDDGPGFYAARVWWLLHWLGHSQVRVLDGGLSAWKNAGLPLTTVHTVKAWPGDFVADIHPEMVLMADKIEQALGTGEFCLIDARAPERFRGEVEPIDPVAGHIPGAVCLPCSGNIGGDGFFLSADLLAKRFPAGQQPVVCYCGSGVTACHNILAAVVAGQPMPMLYAGSWSEWITDPGRPVATDD